MRGKNQIFMLNTILEFIILLPIFLFAVIIHEIAHGWVAYKLGDPTARDLGRLTLNPVRHLDIFGSILLPLVLILINSPAVFGWAKPVPINFLNFKNIRRDIILVSIAGCLVNFLAAVITASIIRLDMLGSFLNAILLQFVLLNLVLGIFNLIPLPPLDGSKILLSVLPKNLMRLYLLMEPFGIVVIFILLSVGFFDKFIFPAMYYLLKLLVG